MILEHKNSSAVVSILLFSFLIILDGFMLSEASSQEAAEYVYIKESKTPLRETIGGKTTADILFSTPVSVIEKEAGWIKVQLTGWIPANSVVSKKSDLQEVSKPISITLNLSSTNRNEDREVDGRVVNADPDAHKVLVFAKTDIWYKQPFCDDRGNQEINRDGTWSTWVRPGRIYVYVVANDYNPPCQLSVPLKVDGKRIFAKAVER